MVTLWASTLSKGMETTVIFSLTLSLMINTFPGFAVGTKVTVTDPVPWLALLIFTNTKLTLLLSEGIFLEGKDQDSTGGVLMTFDEIFER